MAEAPAKTPNPALQVLKQSKELWDKQPKGRRTLAILIVLGVIGFIGITTVLKKTETWAPVAEGMAPVDAQAVYSALIGRGINARMRDNNVEVESDDLGQARAIATMTASTAGLSSMEAQFKDGGMIRTALAEQVAYKMGLEGELARNIVQTAHLASAHVTIAFGKKTAIKDMEMPATASVTVVAQPGAVVSPAVVTGIRQLVAASVDGLDAAKVVVIGPKGPLDGDEKNGGSAQNDIEEGIAAKVKSFLEKKVGAGKVAVVASADMDMSKVEQTQDIYDPTGSAILSTAKSVDGSNPSPTQSSVGGVAGAQGNLPGAPAPTGGSGAGSAAAPGNGHLTETTNYNNSHVITRTIKPEQKIKKLHLAVFVDQAAGKDGKPLERKPEEVAMLKTFAHEAAGLDDARGDTIELTSVAFAPIETPVEPPLAKPLLPVPVPVAIGGGVGVLVLLAIVVLLLKSKKAKKANKTQALVMNRGRLAFPTPVAELERVLDGEPANTTQLPGRELAGLPAPGKTAQERVMEVVRADVERAAGVLTGWLAEAPPAAAKGAK